MENVFVNKDLKEMEKYVKKTVSLIFKTHVMSLDCLSLSSVQADCHPVGDCLNGKWFL